MPKRFKDGLSKFGEVFHYRLLHRGKLYTGTTRCRSLPAAKEWLSSFRDSLALGDVGLKARLIPTFEQLVSEWVLVQKGVVGMTHWNDVQGSFHRHFKTLANLRLDEVTTEKVEAIRTVYLQTRGPGGANNVLKHLNLLFRWAIHRGYIKEKPFRMKKLKVQKRPRAVIGIHQVGEFLQIVDKARNPHVKTAIRLMLGLGLREAEALGARWEWLDWERKIYIPGRTKGKEADPLPLPDWLCEHLRLTTQPCMEGWILPAPDGKPHRSRFTTKSIDRAGRKIGVFGLTPHRMRATFATLHSEHGTPIQIIQRMLRHKHVETTAIYLESSTEAMRLAQDRVSEGLGLQTGATKHEANPTNVVRLVATGT